MTKHTKLSIWHSVLSPICNRGELLYILLAISFTPGSSNTQINKLEFVGNHYIRNPARFINFKPSTLVNDSIINNWQNVLLAVYAQQGFFWTTINIDSTQKDDKINLRFIIQENERAKISSVEFIGNENFSQPQLSKLIKPVIFFSESGLKSQISDVLTFYNNNGFPFASIEARNFTLDNNKKTIAYALNINEGTKVVIDRVTFINAQTQASRLKKIFGIKPSTLYIDSKIKSRLKKLAAQNIDIINYEIIKIDTLYQLQIQVKEKKSQELSGALSYLPQPKELHGFLFLNLNNLFQTLRKVNVGWENYNRFTRYNLTYQDPYLFGFIIAANVSHMVYDTLYAKTDFLTNINFPVRDNLSLYFLAGYDQTISGIIDLANYQTFWIGQGLTIVNLDNPLNPLKGYQVDFSTQLGSRQNQLLSKTSAELQFIHPLPNPFNFSLDLVIKNLYANRELSMSDSLFLGGIRTLRGYKENQFSTNRFLLVRNQLSLFNNQNTNLFGFYDFALLNIINRYQFQSGYGLGLKTISKIGTIEIDYGIPTLNNILSGKIHLKFSTQF